MEKILVLGGTGMLGEPVVRHMLANGMQVRLLARDPEKARAMFGETLEIVPGDATDPVAVEEALSGCDGVHISVGGPAERIAAENAATLASKHKLQRLTYISGATAFEQNRWFPMTEQKLEAEKAIRESGVPFTLFCPTWPMEQLPRFARGGQPLLVGDQPPPFHWFAADDFGRMVAAAYQNPDSAGKKLFVHGPEAMPMNEALSRYCRVFHPEVESVPLMPIEAARATAKSSGNQMLGFFAELMAYFEQVGEMGDPGEANQLLGAPATTLEDWLAEMKSALAPEQK
ncbi:MAG: SDR family oxidoreductase [Candidatus Promineifilaceae bacterium]